MPIRRKDYQKRPLENKTEEISQTCWSRLLCIKPIRWTQRGFSLAQRCASQSELFPYLCRLDVVSNHSSDTLHRVPLQLQNWITSWSDCELETFLWQDCESSFISHAQVSPSQPDDQQIYCKEIHFSLSTDACTLGRCGLIITNSGVIALLV